MKNHNLIRPRHPSTSTGALKKGTLFWSLLVISILGNGLALRAIVILGKGTGIDQLLVLLELGLIGLVLTPWSIKMPSRAAWRPGVPLMMLSIFLLRPELVVVVPIPGLVLITARARAKWWKYFETIAHVGLGLYTGAIVYTYLNRVFEENTFGHIFAVVLALVVHLMVNRLISAVIVAHREHRALWFQVKLTIRELHWGYFNAYLLIVMASMFEPRYMLVGVAAVALIQAGIFVAVSNFSTIKTLQNSVWTDGLTSLENRAAWEALVKGHEKEQLGARLYVIDINNFKDINDRYGHVVGDQVLRELAHALRNCVPENARIFRVGGDEFLVYLASSGANDADLDRAIRYESVKQFEHFTENHEAINISVGEAVAPEDGELLSELLVIGDKRMYEDKRKVRYTKSGLDFGIPASILSLVLATESRDAYTSGHSLRVAFYARKLASHMRLEAHVLQTVFRAGLVHDVGKIGVPDAILNKQGKLSDDELRIIQQHPVTGYEMCRKLGFSQDELDIIRFHHERWDGNGYPARLSGSEIPLIARLTAVADVYDALTSTRAYRSAWSHQQAMRYLIENRFVLFDPVCVDAWVSLNDISIQTDEYFEWVKEAGLLNYDSGLYAI
ncbi:bifunctional diguanylate cyclase/phosphohydrolase [Alicyclobacillus ferrooxydans]|uniref:bifunctional diguanylate cyclase/phosphohydrolase n=1 Tax=Alicyclobacillus ferrooxydans TaxID=471514 RepID=UPI0006D53DE2|nr:diguanylate cyclase [Alicyclobacillus ferrooxydans]